MKAHQRTATIVSGWLGSLVALVLLGLPVARAAGTLLSISEVRTERLPEIAVYVTAADTNGLPLAKLDRDRFRLSHNGQSVLDFALEQVDADQEGISAVIAIDTSGSMVGSSLAAAQAAARLFVDSLAPKDRAALIGFGDRAQMLQDFTSDRALLGQAIDGLTARGETALYDAVFQAATAAGTQLVGRRVIVVITDGEDTRSAVTLDDAVAKTREVNTPVYALGFGEIKPEPLRRLALVSGGSFEEQPSADSLSDGIGRIGGLLRTQYVLRYLAPDSRPEGNEVQVMLSQDGQQLSAARRFNTPPLPPLGITLPDLTNGANVQGIVELSVAVANAPRVDRVEYLLDGQPLGSADEPPYRFKWNTATAPVGEHELVARARLGTREAQQTLKVAIPPPPRIAIRQPTAGVELSGVVRLVPELTGITGQIRIDWSVDDQPVASVDRPPYEADWNTAGLSPGDHALRLTVRDEQGGSQGAAQPVRIAGPLGLAGAATTGPAATPTATSKAFGPLENLPIPPQVLLLGLLALVGIAAVGLQASRRRSAPPQVDQNSQTLLLGQTPTDPAGSASADATTILQPGGPAGPTSADATARLYPGAAQGPTGRASLPRRGPDPAERPGDQTMTWIPGLTSQSGPQASLRITTPGQPDQTWLLTPGEMIIGRDPGPGGIVVDDDQASRHHGDLVWWNEQWIYSDAQPRNPTTVNGEPLHGPHALNSGDRLLIGRSEVTFQVIPG
jgi:Ca-activated chloride channel family protein